AAWVVVLKLEAGDDSLRGTMDIDRIEAVVVVLRAAIRHKKGIHPVSVGFPHFLFPRPISGAQHPLIECYKVESRMEVVYELVMVALPIRPAPIWPERVDASAHCLRRGLEIPG